MIAELCRKYTDLTDQDVEKLLEVSKQVDMIAELLDTDVFIDCLTKDSKAAIVVMHRKNKDCRSIYEHEVTGSFAYMKNEPAVMRTLATGLVTRETKAVTQEGMIVKQTVVPIYNEKKVIGVLISEENVTEYVEKDKKLKMLSDANRNLVDQLISTSDDAFANHLIDGLIICNDEGGVVFYNSAASDIYKKIGYRDKIGDVKFSNLVFDDVTMEGLRQAKKSLTFHHEIYDHHLNVTYTSEQDYFIMIVRDMTNMKLKDQQLKYRNTVLQEVHHRIKGDLQSISSMLRIQLRRVECQEAREYFRAVISRILSISKAHEILSFSMHDKVNMRELMDNLAEIAKDSTDKIVRIKVESEDMDIMPDHATSLSLVINELLQNSIKHGFRRREEGSISIDVKSDEFFVTIRVNDDGNGFDSDDIKSTSLGLQICKSIVEESFKGSFGVERRDIGTESRLTIKKVDII